MDLTQTGSVFWDLIPSDWENKEVMQEHEALTMWRYMISLTELLQEMTPNHPIIYSSMTFFPLWKLSANNVQDCFLFEEGVYHVCSVVNACYLSWCYLIIIICGFQQEVFRSSCLFPNHDSHETEMLLCFTSYFEWNCNIVLQKKER